MSLHLCNALTVTTMRFFFVLLVSNSLLLSSATFDLFSHFPPIYRPQLRNLVVDVAFRERFYHYRLPRQNWLEESVNTLARICAT